MLVGMGKVVLSGYLPLAGRLEEKPLNDLISFTIVGGRNLSSLVIFVSEIDENGIRLPVIHKKEKERVSKTVR